MIFRNDDVNSNTDLKTLSGLYGAIHGIFPDSEIWSCITLFCQNNRIGSVYNEVPFKNKEINWFYSKADSFMHHARHPLYRVVSHGLYHIDHSVVSRQVQEMSIIGSCSYLKADTFVPPFNKYNQDTLDICFDNKINIDVEGWKSLEFEPFDPSHKKWYFHSWRFTPEKLKEVLNGKHSTHMG